MIHMHVPKYFLGNALLTACYLINRVSSSILHGDIPLFTFYKNKSC